MLSLLLSRHPISLVLVGLIACVLAAVIALQDSWKWSELDARVRVLSASELEELVARATARPEQA